MYGFSSSPLPAFEPEDAANRLEEGWDAVLVDVREPWETETGIIEGARLIPLGLLEGRLTELPSDKPVLMVCRSGGRSAMATAMAREAGLQAFNMTGGMLAWKGPVVIP